MTTPEVLGNLRLIIGLFRETRPDLANVVVATISHIENLERLIGEKDHGLRNILSEAGCATVDGGRITKIAQAALDAKAETVRGPS